MNSPASSTAATAVVTINEIIERLREAYPDAGCALYYETPLQLLVATILSAQCTDERVNQVTPLLFKRFPTVADLAESDRVELEAVIRPTGFYRQKARYIQMASRMILHEHGGQVPDEMADLIKLPGVARKTANVTLGEIFSKAEGIVVDTHVKRLSRRLGLTKAKGPEGIERDLMEIVPESAWIELSHLFICHGRLVCHARTPACRDCTLFDLCPSATR